MNKEVFLKEVHLRDIFALLEAWILGKGVYISKKRLWD